MASSSCKGTKKTFTFKKRVDLVEEDDDEDDFIPSKFNPFPSSSSTVRPITKEGKMELSLASSASSSHSTVLTRGKTKACAGKVGTTDNKVIVKESNICKKASQRSLSSSDQENVDDIQCLYEVDSGSSGSSGSSGGGSNTAWKDLMGQMQKNQKEALHISNSKTVGAASIRNATD